MFLNARSPVKEAQNSGFTIEGMKDNVGNIIDDLSQEKFFLTPLSAVFEKFSISAVYKAPEIKEGLEGKCHSVY
jgi:hypothetical protein